MLSFFELGFASSIPNQSKTFLIVFFSTEFPIFIFKFIVQLMEKNHFNRFNSFNKTFERKNWSGARHFWLIAAQLFPFFIFDFI